MFSLHEGLNFNDKHFAKCVKEKKKKYINVLKQILGFKVPMHCNNNTINAK